MITLELLTDNSDFILDLRINPGRFHEVDLEQYTPQLESYTGKLVISQQDEAMKSSRIDLQIHGARSSL